MPSLFELLQSLPPEQQQQGLAPLPTGNVGASPSPLQMGQMVADNRPIDNSLVNTMKNVFGGSSAPAAQAAVPAPQPHAPAPQAVNPYMNWANKATGKNFK
jgi:hypothetical protein